MRRGDVSFFFARRDFSLFSSPHSDETTRERERFRPKKEELTREWSHKAIKQKYGDGAQSPPTPTRERQTTEPTRISREEKRVLRAETRAL
jgi:hypothetical protein